MSYFVFYCYILYVSYLYVSFSGLITSVIVVSVRRGFHFLLVLGVGCVILLWHSLHIPYNYFGKQHVWFKELDIISLVIH